MEHLCTVLPDGDSMLLWLGARFQAVGLVQQAIDAFCKAGDSRTPSRVSKTQAMHSVEAGQLSRKSQAAGLAQHAFC